MKVYLSLFLSLYLSIAASAPAFTPQTPKASIALSNNVDLCNTAQQTLDYINKGPAFDPGVIHGGRVINVPLARVQATLSYICKHKEQMHDPAFVKEHFDFIRWRPDVAHAKKLSKDRPLLKNIPADQILMTKYYVHLAKASHQKTKQTPYPIFGLPKDEFKLSFEEAQAHPELLRFKYGKQAILKGALDHQEVPVLAYLSREDLEAALLEGTVVVDFNGKEKTILNVHRNNNIEYIRTKSPYEQERYWYFKVVDGIKGYGKDADHKITVNEKVTFAGDLTQLGLGKLLMVQYKNKKGDWVNRMGILADTGGAFADNLYQIDFLSGAFANKAEYQRGTKELPDYITAWFMILKQKYS